MKVYVLNLIAEFNNNNYNSVLLYDNFEKAHKGFMKIIERWFN